QRVRFAQFWLMYQLTESPLDLGYVGLAQALPGIVLNLVGGVFADKVDQRRLIMVTQTVTAGLIFLLAGVTFWIMPRGESQLGLPQVAILPFSSNSLDASSAPKGIDPSGIPALPEQESEISAVGLGIGSQPFPTAADTELEASQASSGLYEPIPANAFLGNVSGPDTGGDVAFFVRSKVASYWRGRTLAVFDGRYWRTGNAPEALTRSRFSPQVWYDQESFGLDNRLGYSQTFFIQRDQPDVVFTGYRGVRFIAEEGSLLGAGVRAGDIIVELAGKKIENIYDYTHAIEALKIGQKTKIVVQRGRERITLTLVPGSRE
ncbi:MAG: MFS transporter, partial [Planctomycetes bacterium]|nr:MFS transporter [Planctomycetota bacterium]